MSLLAAQPFQHFAAHWSGSAGSSCAPEGWSRGIQLGAFTSRHPRYFHSHSQMRVCSYAPKVMPLSEWKRWDHKSGVPTSNSSQAHRLHIAPRAAALRAHMDTWERMRQRGLKPPLSFTESRILLENSARWSQHCYMASTVRLPAGRRHKFQGSKLLSNAPVSSSCLLRCSNTIQLTVDIISFLCYSIFKLRSNTNAFNSHFHMPDVLHSF